MAMDPGTASLPAIAVAGLRKAYGGIQALVGVDLAIEVGAVHAVVGENGAGKSTLMKILAGAVHPDAGEVSIGGEPVRLASPADARRLGVGIVYQELSLFPQRSILANLFPDKQPTRFRLVDRAEMRRRAASALAQLGLDADPETPVGELGIAERQLVELCRLLIERPRVLILDEPNSALNERETRRLFAVLRELSAEGITIIYVSHRLEEVFDIAHRITVMRNGAIVATVDRAATTMGWVVEAMVGTSPAELFRPRRGRAAASDGAAATDGPPGDGPPGDRPPSLVVRGLTVDKELRDVSFEAHPGEIIGLAGLEGSGVATLLGVLYGTRRASAGEVAFSDGQGAPASPTAAARRGISLVPADRRHQGLMLEADIEINIAHVAVGTLPSRRPWLDRRAMRAAARRQIDGLRIRADGPRTIVGRLSGGNQQKVVVGKWLEVSPTVFLLDDPTRGVDVGAKREIYRLIRELADSGRTVLFRSTELPEVVGLADRILVLYRGRLAVEAYAGELDDHGLLHAINTGRPPGPEPASPATT
ncbi:MAG: sugar ABC transporter ATP-binding protein [Chloroflexota bacterium]|nr:sugar ABC transporter ATP-binding protein [Chloroflexota bacterium]